MDLRAHFMKQALLVKPALPLAQPPGTIMREPGARRTTSAPRARPTLLPAPGLCIMTVD